LVAPDLLDGASGEDLRARAYGRLAEAARIGERLDRSCAEIEEAGRIGRRADQRARLFGFDDADGRAALLPLPRALLDAGDSGRVGGAMDCADLPQLARDLVLLDDLEDRARRVRQKIEKPLAIDRPEHLLERRWHDPKARIDEPGIAPRRPKTDLDRL